MLISIKKEFMFAIATTVLLGLGSTVAKAQQTVDYGKVGDPVKLVVG